MAHDPYSQTAKLLDAGPSPTKRTAGKSSASASPSPAIPDVVVGKRYTDPESVRNEEYMTGAVKRLNQRMSADNERVSGEYRSRRYNDRRFGRRSGR